MISVKTSSERGWPHAPACSIVRKGFTIHLVAGSGLDGTAAAACLRPYSSCIDTWAVQLSGPCGCVQDGSLWVSQWVSLGRHLDAVFGP
jgi:hypothetical protein